MKRTFRNLALSLFLLLSLTALAVCGLTAAAEDVHVHEYTETVLQAPSHDDVGFARYVCSCGDTYIGVLPARGHVYVKTVIVPGGCTEDGLVRYECECGDSYEEILYATGEHDYVIETIPPTCTDNGMEIQRCTRCGDTQILRSPETDPTATDLLALDHDYVVESRVEPTDDENGYTTYVCTRCGNSYVAVLEHTDKYVAEMYVCAKRMISPLGHMWVYIQNRTDHELQVGAYTLPAGQGVSIGSFALTRADGFGLYYNVEAYCVNKYGIKSMICMETKLTQAQLDNVSKRILNGNLWTLILYNCMGTAFTIWNGGPGQKLIPLLFPFIGRLEMLVYPHEDSIEMYYPTENQVFKQRGNGSSATLEKVSQSSLANGI